MKSDKTVKLGLMPPLTGLVGMYGKEISHAGLIACQEINESGGILGCPLELIIEDDGSLPDSAVVAAEKLLDEHQCDAIVGNLLSNSRIAVAYRVAEPRRVPYLNFSFYEGSILSRYFFHFAALPNQQIDKMIPYMKDKFGPRMFFAGHNYEWPRGSIHAGKLALTRAGGTVVGEHYTPIAVESEQIEEILDQLEQIQPDVFVPYFAGEAQALLLTRFTERGLKDRIAVVMGHYDELLASHLTPEVRAGFYSSNTYFMSIDSEQNKNYLKRLAALPDVDGIWPNGNGFLTNFGEGTYVCIKAFAKAVNQAGTLDKELVVDALRTLELDAPQGHVTMHPENHHAKVNTYLTKCNKDGVFEIVERFGAIDPVLPDRYNHQRISHQATLEEDIRLQARMLEQLNEAIALVSTDDGSILYSNRGAEKMFGYSKEELIGMSIADLKDESHPLVGYSAVEIISVLKQKGEWSGELDFIRKDGRTIQCQVNITTFTHPVYGEVWLGVHHDVTETNTTNRELQNFRNTLDKTYDCVFMFDTDRLQFTYANRGAIEQVGYSKEELLKMHPYDIKPEISELHFREMILPMLSGQRETLSFSTVHQHKDGTRIPVEILLQYIHDTTPRFIAIVRDVTERKRVQDALAESEARYRRAELGTNDGLWEWNVVTGEDYFSPRWLALLGYKPGELPYVVDSFIKLIHPDDVEHVKLAVDDHFTKNTVFDVEMRLRHKSGQYIWVNSRGQADRNNKGEPVLMSGFITDISDKKKAIQDLEFNQARFAAMFESITDAVVVADTERRMTVLNSSVERLFGYNKNELLGKPTSVLYADESDFKQAGKKRFNVDAQKRSDPYTIKYRRKDGSMFWGETLGTKIESEDGEVYGFVGVIRDISERVRAEKELQSALDLNNQVINSSPIGIVIFSDNGQCIAANQSMATILGASREQVMALNYNTLETWKTYGLLEKVEKAKRENKRIRGEFDMISSFGKSAIYDIIFVPFEFNGESSMLIMADDVTEYKQAQKHIAEQSNLLDQIFNYTIDNMVVLDKDYNFVRVSESYARTCKREPSDFIGKNHFDLYPSDFEQEIEPFVRNKKVYKRYSRPFEHPDVNLTTYWDIGLVPITDSKNEIEKLLLTLKDVTEKENAERELKRHRDHLEELIQERTEELMYAKNEAERANAAKSDFLSRMSHELRTPLNAILGYGQLMQIDETDPLSQSQGQSVEEIITAGNHLLALVNEILELSQIESGRLDLTIKPMKINSLIQMSITQIQPLAYNRGITIKTELSELATIDADELRVKEILLNLLSNAIKYNKEAGQITVRSRIRDEYIRVEIEDTGTGIPQESITRLFKPFERLVTAYEGIEGTGIGLALVKRMVEAMGGEVGVNSQYGVGSLFWFELPVSASNTNVAKKKKKSELHFFQGPAREKMYKLLYIEDNPANLKLVQTIIGKYENFEFCYAMNGEEGLVLAARELPDVILLDINLPGLGGFEVLKELRDKRLTANIPVIAVTANAMEADIKRGEEAGFESYLTKPFDITEFISIIKQHLPEWDAREVAG